MSMEINSVVLGGNLTADVTLKQTPSGQSVCSFSLATNRTTMRQQERVQETSFFDVEVWGVVAENCQKFLSKGSPVVVVGRMKQDRWQNESGETRSKVKVVATNVQFLPSKRNASESQDMGPSGW